MDITEEGGIGVNIGPLPTGVSDKEVWETPVNTGYEIFLEIFNVFSQIIHRNFKFA